MASKLGLIAAVIEAPAAGWVPRTCMQVRAAPVTLLLPPLWHASTMPPRAAARHVRTVSGAGGC